MNFNFSSHFEANFRFLLVLLGIVTVSDQSHCLIELELLKKVLVIVGKTVGLCSYRSVTNSGAAVLFLGLSVGIAVNFRLQDN
jgi:hypothetical protein